MRNLCWCLALVSAMWSCSTNEVTPPAPPIPPPTTPPTVPVDTPPKMKDWVMTTAYGDFIFFDAHKSSFICPYKVSIGAKMYHQVCLWIRTKSGV